MIVLIDKAGVKAERTIQKHREGKDEMCSGGVFDAV